MSEEEQIRLISTMDVLDGLRKFFKDLEELDGKRVKLSLIFILYDLLKALDLASAENIRYCSGREDAIIEIDSGQP